MTAADKSIFLNSAEQMKENLEKDMLSHCPPSATSPTLMGKGFRRLASPKKVIFRLLLPLNFTVLCCRIA